MSIISKCRGQELGQMTVEFVVIIPVVILIALISVNVILFFSECASFDNRFKQEVCRVAAIPAHQQSLEQSLSQIESSLNASFDKDYLEVGKVSVEKEMFTQNFSADLIFSPTLFGRPLASSVLGVEFFKLNHRSSFQVAVYQPGAVL